MTAMHGDISVDDTPGGGLTVTIMLAPAMNGTVGGAPTTNGGADGAPA